MIDRKTKIITIELDEPILTEEGYNIHEVVLMDQIKQLKELLLEARESLAAHTLTDASPACYLCGGEVGCDVGRDCPSSHDYELAQKIDYVLEEHKRLER